MLECWSAGTEADTTRSSLGLPHEATWAARVEILTMAVPTY